MFMIRRGQLLKNQEAPIYLRITVDGESVEISIKRSIPPERWDEFRRCAKTGSPYAKELNYYLEQIRHKVYDHQHELIDKNKTVSATALKKAFLNSDQEESRTLLQVYADHNADLKSRIDKGISKCTFIRHESSRNNLERFIKANYKKNDFLLQDIDNAFILKYEVFLRTKRNCNNNSTVKYIRNFGKIIKLALDNDWIKDDPMRKIKLRIEEVDKEFLNNQELQSIADKTLTVPRVSQVRDIFVFCCYTGLAYVDVKSLTKADIITAPDGTLWIKKQRHKSKVWAHIPILPPAMLILDRYKMNPNCMSKGVLFPVLSNQKMNAYLKEVADLCGIDKKLTTHCARHTFATTVTLANNISMASVSKMLGHTNLNMTMKYAKIQDSTIGQEMNQLAEKLQFHMN
jgi:site-specific recombinase XerD